MVGFRDATFFTALAMNASTVLSLSLALFIAFYFCLLYQDFPHQGQLYLVMHNILVPYLISADIRDFFCNLSV